MNALKNIPLRFTGELHEVHLVNFSVSMDEIRDQIPTGIRPRNFDGRAMISMVDVRLRNMKVQTRLVPFRFHYQHIGFRLLIEDVAYHEHGQHKGIHFLRSFSNSGLMVWGGRLFTDYKLEKAHIQNYAGGMEVRKSAQYLRYILQGPTEDISQKVKTLKNTIGAIDRAYAIRDESLFMTKIMREKWPLKAMNCNQFETNFFSSARLEGVFKVPETIHYTWLPATPVKAASSFTLSPTKTFQRGMLTS